MRFNFKITIAALAVFVASTGALAQVKKKPVPSPKSKPTNKAAQIQTAALPVDKNVTIGKLPNGLTYYIRPNAYPQNRAELYLVVKAGSILETDAQQGLAHFAEHMAFNGTRDFPKTSLVSFLQSSGIKFGADLNASTSFDETVYQLPLPTDSTALFEKGFDILANWAGYVSFDQAELDKERGVVLEELRLRGKNAQERLQNQILPAILNNSRYATRLPKGKEDVIKNFDAATIKSFYQDWYRPNLQAVIAVGDFDPAKVEQLIKQKFSGLKNPATVKPRTEYNVPVTPGTTVKFATDPEFPYTLAEIIVKLPGTKVKTAADYLQSIRVSLFNQMLNARLAELMQKPTPPFLYGNASYGGFIGDQDAFTSVVVARPGELEGALKTLVGETERARQFGFTLTEFERAKQNALIELGNAYKERDKTRSSNFVAEYQQHFLEGQAIPGIAFEYQFYLDNIDKITLAQMNGMAGKFISDQNRAIIVEAPDSEKDKLPAEAALLGWITAAGKGLTPYVDNVSTKPLMEKIPDAGVIAEETKDDSIGVTTLVFQNGIKAILKPTNFKNDQIIITGYGLGGTSLASDMDFTSASLAASVVGGSGISEFNQIQLQKMMTGKNVNISPYISEYTQGFSGNATPADLETALQLIHLYFTEPRKDNDIWQSVLSQTQSVLINRNLDPSSVFQDTVTAVLNRYNFRAMVPTVGRLNTASLDKAFDFYKSSFADPGGFTFTFVGNFDVLSMKAVLATYLGSLPAGNAKKTYKDLNMNPPSGQITKIVNKGIGDKSTVQLVFSGDYEYNEVNNIQLDALEEVLNIKLVERLREQESGVYAPGVRARYMKVPSGHYSITVGFSCAPENVDKLIAATLDEINKIKTNGAQETDIKKFKAEDMRAKQVQLRENYFWAGYLAGGAQNQEDPHRIINYPKTLETVTVQSTKETANKYLSGKNLIKFILMPEKKQAAQ
ncbi:insulinase family protein [Mucilaginibacter limnophilus]|uniref:Insulinase family protein n=1 Tax=Mucilaginibacter limnophilus TaxID=1932778 RepID=A0A3S2UQ21_9SPHI|nr:M16 family metallopeptidase [Mucilaginibacter limnophilus]RVU01645.1 insulinase family protein [Mucilaginibacter limnophilus]